MSDTLIFTGWGLPVYASAAAMALRCKFACDADVEGVSRRYLAKLLERKAVNYERVYILGVGLDVEPKRTAEAVMALKGKGIRVTWISDRPLAKELAPFFRGRGESSCFTEMLVDESGDLLDAIRAAFPREVRKEDVEFFRDYAEEKPKENTERGKYRKLFAAADWMHKTYREYDHYPEAIRSLAERKPASAFSEEQKKLIEFFEKWGRRELLGTSEHIREVRELVKLAAKHDEAETRVLITGPSGTGKETVAQQIHARSDRKHGPFMSFNCACTTDSLFEAKLFGHTGNAYTGAGGKEQEGLFASAENGTLFLDEIGELNKDLQGQLLRVLQDGEYQMVGSSEIHKVKNVRIIAATNRDLVKMVQEGSFREDLYHRLNVVQIRMKGLRERPEDIAEIANGLWYRDTRKRLSSEQLQALEKYEYPGNARELENMLVRARALEITDFDELVRQQRQDSAGLCKGAAGAVAPAGGDESLDAVSKAHVQAVYRKYRALGMPQKKIANEILKVSENTMKRML